MVSTRKPASLRKALVHGKLMERMLESSVLAKAVYMPEAHTLLLTFRSGKVYAYLNVPRSEYIGLVNAWSHGTYFNEEIKPRYTFRKISP